MNRYRGVEIPDLPDGALEGWKLGVNSVLRVVSAGVGFGGKLESYCPYDSDRCHDEYTLVSDGGCGCRNCKRFRRVAR